MDNSIKSSKIKAFPVNKFVDNVDERIKILDFSLTETQRSIRHCEEHSDEAIQDRADMESAPTMDCFAPLAMTGVPLWSL